MAVSRRKATTRPAGTTKTGTTKTGHDHESSERAKTNGRRRRARRERDRRHPRSNQTRCRQARRRQDRSRRTCRSVSSSDFVGFHLRLAQDASYRAFARHRDKDLIKPGRFPALAIIHLNPGISQSALGRAIARDKSTVSPLIKDLQKNGFISRKPSALRPAQRDACRSPRRGERTLDRLHARAKEHETELDRIVGASKSPDLMSLLEKIIQGMAA